MGQNVIGIGFLYLLGIHIGIVIQNFLFPVESYENSIVSSGNLGESLLGILIGISIEFLV